MGDYLTKGTTYADGNQVNAANLNAHVDDAVFKATAISARTAKDPAALSDEHLINDAGTLKKCTNTVLYEVFIKAGSVIQTVEAGYTANSDLTTILPTDDTIPQNTEGTQIISLSITPRFSDSTILLNFHGFGSTSTATTDLAAALFRDSVASALAASTVVVDTGGVRRQVALCYLDSPATVSQVDYKIRVGPGTAATVRMNGSNAVRQFGGVARASLTAMEIKV